MRRFFGWMSGLQNAAAFLPTKAFPLAFARAWFILDSDAPIKRAQNRRGKRDGNRRFLHMSELREIKPEEIKDNFFDLIGKRWALLTAGNEERFNTMTVSWGGAGVVWGQPAVFVFVRPQRYTYEFLRTSAGFTLSFYGEEQRKALSLLGAKSGRDGDKVAESGLTPAFAHNRVYFQEARLVLFCDKLYDEHFAPAGFKRRDIIEPCYPEKDYHRVLIGGITRVLSAD